MGQRWTINGQPGWDLEQIMLNDQECVRVRRLSSLIGSAYTSDQLGRLLKRYGLSLADLTEIPDTSR